MDPGIPGTNNEPLNVSEYEIYAKTYLSKNAFDYYASGANAMQTLAYVYRIIYSKWIFKMDIQKWKFEYLLEKIKMHSRDFESFLACYAMSLT